MEVRDKLNTEERYLEIIERQNQYIQEWFEKIKSLEEADKKDIQLFKLPNTEVIRNTYDGILDYQYDNFIAKYSVGVSIPELRKEFISILPLMEKSWKKYSGYIEKVWMLSIGIMLEIDSSIFSRLITLAEKDNHEDFLIDFLISYLFSSWKGQSKKFMYNRPYQATAEIVSLSQTDKVKGLERLKKYLTKEWYRGHSDSGWHDSHKSEWNIHTGYWSFESGALVKILGLDDSSLKGMQYYPYDMVHWAGEEPKSSGHSWILD